METKQKVMMMYLQ